MGDLECNLMKTKLTEWETLDTDGEKFVYGRLKALEDLALHIEVMRESLTRLLVTNTGGACETDEDLKKRWKGVNGLDNEVKKSIDEFTQTEETEEVKIL